MCEVITGANNSFDPLVGVYDDEVEERLPREVDAVLNALDVLDPFSCLSAVLIEGVECGTHVHDAVFEEGAFAVAGRHHSSEFGSVTGGDSEPSAYAVDS